MSVQKRNGDRRSREQIYRKRSPELGYYIIVTDTAQTEQNYINGFRDSIPPELRAKLVIKVLRTKTADLVQDALEQAALYPQYGEIWIVFDRDEVKDFDKIIESAINSGIKVGWTNPCIEEWFFAYFGSMPVCSGSVNCCSEFGKVFCKKTNCKYSKNDKTIYEKLSGYGDESKAISIAESKLREHISNGIEVPSKQTPATTLHMLIKEIRAKTQK